MDIWYITQVFLGKDRCKKKCLTYCTLIHHHQLKVKGPLVADVLNRQHARTGATWRIKYEDIVNLHGAEAYRDGRPPTAC